MSTNNHHVSINDHIEDHGIHEEEEIIPGAPMCFNCQKYHSSYECFPCKCNKFCKKCAMKMGTGGKCKTCHNLFVSMTHMIHGSNTNGENGADNNDNNDDNNEEK